jgi:hypothetical protein
MSTKYQHLTAIDVSPEQASQRAAQLLAWLIAADIIEATPNKRADGYHLEWYQHRKGAERLFRAEGGQCLGNGIGVRAGWVISAPGFADTELHCPRCTWPHDFGKASDCMAKFSQHVVSTMDCHICGYSGGFNSWRLSPPFALGHLQLDFRDFAMLTEEGVKELMQQIGGEVRYSYGDL